MKLNIKTLIPVISMIFVVVSCSPNVKPIDSEDVKSEGEVEVKSEDSLNTEQEEVVVIEDNSNIVDEERFEYLLENKKSGGPPPDGIPPIEEPDYISIVEASPNMESNEPVFVLELEESVYIYPQRVLVWHEIVNLVDKDIALTYCPLTGSAITYRFPEEVDTTFGTSGSLINSNLLMYDRHSDSFISQIDGIGLDKGLKGVELDTYPTYWMEWQVARKAYPDALVLSDETGFIRNYNKDPYGSYTNEVSGNYYVEPSLIFPPLVDDEEDVFHEKYPVIGIKSGMERLALDPLVVKSDLVRTFELNDIEYISFYDEQIKNVRIYMNDNFTIDFDDRLIIGSDGLEYNFSGQGESTKLESPIYFEVMWFAWYGFYPDTEVIHE